MLISRVAELDKQLEDIHKENGNKASASPRLVAGPPAARPCCLLLMLRSSSSLVLSTVSCVLSIAEEALDLKERLKSSHTDIK
jgi:hypothetical protein